MREFQVELINRECQNTTLTFECESCYFNFSQMPHRGFYVDGAKVTVDDNITGIILK